MKLWGGRFEGRRDPLFEKFSESFSIDQRLIAYDLRVNLAYVRELGRVQVLTRNEVSALTRGLDTIARDVKQNPRWAARQESEDVHSWVEARLEKQIGPVAGKLRTGRSRNDLVATETRLYAKDAVCELQNNVAGVLEALLHQARANQPVILPGYTHLQPAQPVLFAHYLLAYFEMLMRDVARLQECYARVDELPMGAGALAGSAFPIDRSRLARDLGFARVARNSLDVTSDRDFVCDLLFACSMILIHLSRLSEDFIIYSTPALGFVEIHDAYATGSSLMPQKKNADTLELIRAKAARVLGGLTSMLALLKGLPLAYDRDLQEDKEVLFSAVDTTSDCLVLAGRVVGTLRIRADRMREATALGFLTATEIADALVHRGIAFAQAHEQVGKLVRYCVDNNKTFADLTLDEGRRLIASWDKTLARTAVSSELSVRRKNAIGGTAPSQVSSQLAAANRILKRLWKDLAKMPASRGTGVSPGALR
ncbi:MAG: argininosuccinate lyase [Acidobacteria bacterium]|nr:MAG: argininosuccinate lyase [Acidobacteriota bacterium]